jgi:hypothetical protein
MAKSVVCKLPHLFGRQIKIGSDVYSIGQSGVCEMHDHHADELLKLPVWDMEDAPVKKAVPVAFEPAPTKVLRVPPVQHQEPNHPLHPARHPGDQPSSLRAASAPILSAPLPLAQPVEKVLPVAQAEPAALPLAPDGLPPKQDVLPMKKRKGNFR